MAPLRQVGKSRLHRDLRRRMFPCHLVAVPPTRSDFGTRSTAAGAGALGYPACARETARPHPTRRGFEQLKRSEPTQGPKSSHDQGLARLGIRRSKSSTSYGRGSTAAREREREQMLERLEYSRLQSGTDRWSPPCQPGFRSISVTRRLRVTADARLRIVGSTLDMSSAPLSPASRGSVPCR